MNLDSCYEWDTVNLVRLEWVEDGDRLARLTVTNMDGTKDIIEIVAVSRGRLLPAAVEVQDKTP